MYTRTHTGLPTTALTSAPAASGMESGPAVLAGSVLVLFGAALLLWTSVRVRVREPVVEGVSPVTGVALGVVFGVISLMTGGWLLLSA